MFSSYLGEDDDTRTPSVIGDRLEPEGEFLFYGY